MTDETLAPDAGANVELSSEPLSQEIGASEEVAAPEVEAAPAEGSAEELEAAVEEAIEDGATKEEVQELIETFKIKVNGKEKDVTLDWNNKDDIIRRLQLAEAGQSSMQRAAELEKGFERSIQEILDDPWAALEELGFDVDDLAEKRIQNQIEQLKKSPEQLAQEARDKELEQLRQKLKEEEERREEIEFARLQQEAEIDLDNQITAALNATTQLPKSPYVVKRIADAMLTAMENGREDVTASDVIPWVEKEMNEEMQALLQEMPDKMLESYIGNNIVDRLRKSRLAKMPSQSAQSIKETAKQPEKKDDKKKKNININDWLRHGSSLSDFER